MKTVTQRLGLQIPAGIALAAAAVETCGKR